MSKINIHILIFVHNKDGIKWNLLFIKFSAYGVKLYLAQKLHQP